MKSKSLIEKQIRVVGLRRSGNHAIINWILKQQNGEKVFLNDVSLPDILYCKEPLKIAQTIDIHLAVFAYSFEDYPLNRVNSHLVEKKMHPESTIVRKRYDILVLRDPFNLFASRLRANLFQPKTRALTLADLWIMYAREYLSITNYLKHNKLVINYNQWCTDKSYRQKLAERLELDFTDEGFEEVPNVGKGSSFDGLSYHNRASEMELFQRWKRMTNNDEYINLFRDKRVVELSEKIFGQFGELDVFIDNYIAPRYSSCAFLLAKIRYAKWVLIAPLVFNARYYFKKVCTVPANFL